MKRALAIGLAALASFAALAPGVAAPLPVVEADRAVAQESTADIVDTAIAAGDFATLVTAVQAAGLEETLRGEGPFTVFAPTDAAFSALPAGTLDALLADPEALAQVLLYHVVAGQVLAADVVGLTSAVTVNGEAITIQVVDGGVVLNGTVNVVATDIIASNGVIHVLDAVLIPPMLAEDPAPADTGNAGLVTASMAAWVGLAALLATVVALGGARALTARVRR